jgi:hypothetical protein
MHNAVVAVLACLVGVKRETGSGDYHVVLSENLPRSATQTWQANVISVDMIKRA